MMDSSRPKAIPHEFIWRRLQSLAGFFLVIFIVAHLFTNSQAVFFIGDDGRDFIHSVNSIHDMPYLILIEIGLILAPLIIHTIWGIKYLLAANYNSLGNNGKTPYLPYPKNCAYTWQRITSYLLIVGVLAHVIHMRFIDYPVTGHQKNQKTYSVEVSFDDGLFPLAKRLNVQLFAKEAFYNDSKQFNPLKEQLKEHPEDWILKWQSHPIDSGNVIVVSDNFGTAELFIVRNTFKSFNMIILYSMLVIIACYHAFNGLFTFMITWGITLSLRSQALMRKVTYGLMALFIFLGLSTVWMTYWVNLRT